MNFLEELKFYKIGTINTQLRPIINKNIKDIKTIIESTKDKDLIYEKVKRIVQSSAYNYTLGKMNTESIMLLISYYCYIIEPIILLSTRFNNVVKSAMVYENAKTKVFNIAINYDKINYDYKLIDDFVVNIKDINYLKEYLLEVESANEERITDLIIETRDNNFKREVLTSDLPLNGSLLKKIELSIIDTI